MCIHSEKLHTCLLNANFSCKKNFIYWKITKINMSNTCVGYIKNTNILQKNKKQQRITVFTTLNNNFIKSRTRKNMKA